MSTPDFFRSRLDAMIDLRHPLAVLATKMLPASIETTHAPLFARRSRDGRVNVGMGRKRSSPSSFGKVGRTV
jgi:IS5 family transposase